MTDNEARLQRLDSLARLAGHDHVRPAPGTLEARLAQREVHMLRDSLEQTRAVAKDLLRRGEARGASMARRSVQRLELELLAARAAAAGITVPLRERSRGPFERAAVVLP